MSSTLLLVCCSWSAFLPVCFSPVLLFFLSLLKYDVSKQEPTISQKVTQNEMDVKRQDRVESCLRVLQVSSREGAASGEELTRGLPGEPLTKGDMTLLELKPLKAFLPGEVN